MKSASAFFGLDVVILAASLAGLWGCAQGGPSMEVSNFQQNSLNSFQFASNSQTPTYEDDIKPKIIQRVCAECHGVRPSIPNWLIYSEAKAKCQLISYKVRNRIMPLSSAKINHLTDQEIAMVVAWTNANCPRTAADIVAPPSP